MAQPARRGWLAGLLALSLYGCNGSPTSPSETPRPDPVPSVAAANALAVEIVDLTNVERQRVGLAALGNNARLARAALLQAEQIAQLGRLEHVLPEARYPQPEDRLAAAGYRWQAYGENLATGFSDAASVVNGWMNSPGHRANMLSASFTEVGVALVADRAGRSYYAQVFGRPR